MTSKELLQKYPGKDFGNGLINVKREYDYPLTGKMKYGSPEKDYSEGAQVIDKGWQIYLYHSCDEWVIGTLEDAKQFRSCLEEAIQYCEQFV